jgi:acyl-CoA dehydrogenase
MSTALDRHLTEAQRELYESTRRLALETLRPIADAGEPGRVNRPMIAALAEHGLLTRVFDPDDGIPAIELCLIREALARGCTEAETAFALQGLGAYPILQAGSDSIRSEWIPRVADGTAVAAFALTEPGAGSDPAALSLEAAPDGDGGHRLTGEKLWISNAPDADIYTVFARTDCNGRGARGLTAFAIPGCRGPNRRTQTAARAARDRLTALRWRPRRPRTDPRRARCRLSRRHAHSGSVPPERGRIRDRDGARRA